MNSWVLRNQKVRGPSPTTNPPLPFLHPTEDVANNASGLGRVLAPRTGAEAISSAHNGSARVVQVVVRHAPRAACEIEREAFPRSWRSSRASVRENKRAGRRMDTPGFKSHECILF